MTVALMSIFAALNIIIILIKYEKERYLDMFVDVTILVLIMMVFSGTNESRAIGTFASMIISVYLYVRPPKLPKGIL